MLGLLQWILIYIYLSGSITITRAHLKLYSFNSSFEALKLELLEVSVNIRDMIRESIKFRLCDAQVSGY